MKKLRKLTDEELAKADAVVDEFIDAIAGPNDELRALLDEMKQTIRNAAATGSYAPNDVFEFLAKRKHK